MPTEHKKKSKTKEKKPAVLVKSEPQDIYPLAHYVDDKVELIRQIFTSLKTKTIHSITPDFLHDRSVEQLQEICLEEVLGISKKRLLSIVNATKCPTDTETSESDSDVEKIDAHVSMEEISSDSDDGLTKKSRHPVKKTTKANAKDSAKSKAVANNGEPKKEYSVLELLELQARARAIRSQLALEPVTKIELKDSDGEDVIAVSEPTVEAKEISKDVQSITTTALQPETIADATNSVEPVIRPVRLKRNFRQRKVDEDDESSPNLPAENTSAPVNESESKKIVDDTSNQDKEEQIEKNKERSPSPDVIPIVKEPEVLYISSGDESENDSSSYIKFPLVPKEKGPETEDEIFLRKVKEAAEIAKTQGKNNETASPRLNSAEEKIQSQATVSSQEGATTELEVTDNNVHPKSVSSVLSDEKIADEPKQAPEPTPDPEPLEDGEIVDDDEPEKSVEIVHLDEDSNSSHSSTSSSSSNSSTGSSSTSSTNQPELKNEENVSELVTDEVDMKNVDSTDANSNRSNPNISIEKVIVEDEEDADIIDLGKDEDLDFEISCNSKSLSKKRKTADNEQSTQSTHDNESWGTRWLRGRKVSSVLATSKLASKVRSKIKEKKAKIEVKKDEEVVTETPPETIINTNVEVGSVEHYKELTKNL